MGLDSKLFESFARKRAEMGTPLIESSELSTEENAIVRRVNAEVKAATKPRRTIHENPARTCR